MRTSLTDLFDLLTYLEYLGSLITLSATYDHRQFPSVSVRFAWFFRSPQFTRGEFDFLDHAGAFYRLSKGLTVDMIRQLSLTFSYHIQQF